jgi:hypothetical protein
MIFSSIFRFLVNPINKDERINISRKLFYFGVLFICTLILVYGLTIILQLFIPQPSHKADELSLLKLIAYGLFLAPVFEELIFRLSLKYSILNLSVSLCLAQTAIITTLLDIKLLTFQGGILFLFLFVLFIIFLNNHKTASKRLEKVWNYHFGRVFYISSLLFCLFHTVNYEIIDLNSFLVAFLFSFPLFIGALLLGYTRIRLGFL